MTNHILYSRRIQITSEPHTIKMAVRFHLNHLCAENKSYIANLHLQIAHQIYGNVHIMFSLSDKCEPMSAHYRNLENT